MKKIIVAVLVLIVAAGLFMALSPKNSTHTTTTTTTKSSPSKFAIIQSNVKNGALLLDVRTASEYATGHFPSATNFSLQDMQAGKLPSVTKMTKIYVYCHSGNRAGQAYVILKDNGYDNVTDLGGLADVQALGGTLTTQ